MMCKMYIHIHTYYKPWLLRLQRTSVASTLHNPKIWPLYHMRRKHLRPAKSYTNIH